MAVVYLAWDRGLARHAAVKVLRPALSEDPAMARRFLQEGRTAAGLAFFIAAGEGTAGASAGWEESPCAGASGTTSGTGRASAGTVGSAASADAGAASVAGDCWSSGCM